MADNFDSDLGIRLIETGAYEDTWGSVLNSDSFGLALKAVSGRATITLTGTTYSMPTMNQGAASDSRAAILRFIGSPSGAVTVTFPGTVRNKLYLVENQCGQAITFTYGGAGDTATVAAGVNGFLSCDGTDVLSPGGGATNADTLGGIAAASYARRDVANVFAKVNSFPWFTVVEAPSTTIVATDGNHQRLTLTADRTMAAPTGAVDGQPLVLQIKQDAVGGRLISSWHPDFLFENGLAPTLAATANAVDLFLMYYDASVTKWIVGHFGSIAPATGASYNLVLEGNQCDVSLAGLLGTVAVASVVNLTIAQGAVLQALSTASYALDLYGVLPAGSTLNLFNLGYVQGRGGDAGDGAAEADQGGGQLGNITAGYNGRAGGDAMRGPGAGITFNVTNANGRIRGGGGGGGGGGATTGANGIANGGGGGGGVGGGRGGRGGRAWISNYAADGTDGSTGVNGVPGAGGNGNGVTITGYNGGDGGDWGSAGSTATGAGLAGGTGGGAGKAIELSGGTANFVSGSGSPNVAGAVS